MLLESLDGYLRKIETPIRNHLVPFCTHQVSFFANIPAPHLLPIYHIFSFQLLTPNF